MSEPQFDARPFSLGHVSAVLAVLAARFVIRDSRETFSRFAEARRSLR